MKNYYVPQYINKNNWLWWEKEEVKYVALPFIVFALVLNYFILGAFFSIFASYLAIKLRRGKPEGYLVHLQYAKVPVNPDRKGFLSLILKERSFPNSKYKHIIG